VGIVGVTGFVGVIVAIDCGVVVGVVVVSGAGALFVG
jgi:hypothetical protein